MTKRESCKYFGGIVCTKHGIGRCSRCKDYVSAYTRCSCKHYDKEKNECRILADHDILGPPCSRPKLNKTGKPVKCTFYEFCKAVKSNDEECQEA